MHLRMLSLHLCVCVWSDMRLYVQTNNSCLVCVWCVFSKSLKTTLLPLLRMPSSKKPTWKWTRSRTKTRSQQQRRKVLSEVERALLRVILFVNSIVLRFKEQIKMIGPASIQTGVADAGPGPGSIQHRPSNDPGSI